MPDIRLKSEKTTICFVNWKIHNTVFPNKTKPKKSNNEKYDFREITKIFTNESLTAMKEAIALNCRNLNRKFVIHSCYNRNGAINVKRD